jgi:hypothetical protein
LIELSKLPNQDRYRTLGWLFVLFGLIAFVVSTVLRVAPIAGFGLGAFLVGLLMVYLPTAAPTFTSDLIGEAFLPTMTNLEGLLTGLGLGGSATYIPPDDKSGRLKIFVPLTENQSPPTGSEASSDIFIIAEGNPGRLGVVLEPPGSGLLAMVEREGQQDFGEVDLASFEEALRVGLVESLELLSSVHVTIEGRRVQFIGEGDVLWKFTERLAKQTPTVCQKIGCPFCSLAACALTKSAHTNVTFVQAEHFKGTHRSTLELAE